MSKMKNIIKVQSKLALKQIHLHNSKLQVSTEYHLNQHLKGITKEVQIFKGKIVVKYATHSHQKFVNASTFNCVGQN